MTRDRSPATAAQAKALGSPIRLRILRLCLHDELTNQQLAERLGCDPSTLHYHARILLDAGFLERADTRHGPTGALEKPFRSTGLSWTIDIGTDNVDATLAMLDAFRAELAEGGSRVGRVVVAVRAPSRRRRPGRDDGTNPTRSSTSTKPPTTIAVTSTSHDSADCSCCISSPTPDRFRRRGVPAHPRGHDRSLIRTGSPNYSSRSGSDPSKAASRDSATPNEVRRFT